jgi:hypothetical protein
MWMALCISLTFVCQPLPRHLNSTRWGRLQAGRRERGRVYLKLLEREPSRLVLVELLPGRLFVRKPW